MEEGGSSSGYIAPHFPWPDDNVTFSHRMLISVGKVIAPGGEQGTNMARIYQTTDNGASWTKLAASGLPTAANRAILDAVASPDDASDFIVFCSGNTGAGAGGIYRTTNAGANFTQATGIPAGKATGDLFYWHPSLERDATDPAVRYLFFRNVGFFKSTDRARRAANPPRSRATRIRGCMWILSPGASGSALNSATASTTARMAARRGRPRAASRA